jgi:ferric-dicitrate binding protein FerR (iron transport regulator)
MTQIPDDSAERLDRQLSEALQATPLSSEALIRIQAAVRQEWASTHQGRPRGRSQQRLWSALAAAVGSIALMLAWVMRPPPAPAVFGSVSRVENGRTLLDSSRVQHRTLQVGDILRSGDELTAHGVGLISLPSGSNLRISADTVIRVSGQSDVELLRGMIYIDHPPPAAESTQLRVHTRAGTIEHVGTEFEVFSNEQMVRLRVREGRVRLRNSGQDIIAAAGMEVVAMADGHISRASWPTNGDSWRWVSSLAPSYEIEGRPLLAFLEFESRELGYQLIFADAHAREVAERTILHGTVRGREPLDAVTSVLATTSLSYSIRGNTLQVQSGNGT